VRDAGLKFSALTWRSERSDLLRRHFPLSHLSTFCRTYRQRPRFRIARLSRVPSALSDSYSGVEFERFPSPSRGDLPRRCAMVPPRAFSDNWLPARALGRRASPGPASLFFFLLHSAAGAKGCPMNLSFDFAALNTLPQSKKKSSERPLQKVMVSFPFQAGV